MLSLSPSVRIFVHTQPTDMRKQFNGLYGIVTHSLGQDVMAGDYFVFFNRRRWCLSWRRSVGWDTHFHKKSDKH